jgi:hypothetical protein
LQLGSTWRVFFFKKNTQASRPRIISTNSAIPTPIPAFAPRLSDDGPVLFDEEDVAEVGFGGLDEVEEATLDEKAVEESASVDVDVADVVCAVLNIPEE